MRRALLLILVIIVLGAAAFVVLARQPEIAASEPPAKSAFDAALVTKGAQLASIGNCNSCHTAEGGRAFAGGRPLPTPFGTIYGSNITPDPETGIGRWSEAAFRRAMHEGVDREGRHLYPAFPYDHFTKVTDDDVKAIYAFVMTREPVRARTPDNALPFPFNIRMTLAGWKLLFLRRGVYQPDASKSAELNRGGYLVDGLAHCGACHTPRNRLGAERRREYLAGGTAEGWQAPALNAHSSAPVPWTADSLFAYLRQGFADQHGAAAGPMAPVVRNLAEAPEADVHAIAAYIASVMGSPPPERQKQADELVARLKQGDGGTASTAANAPAGAGAALFAGACAGCHTEARPSGSINAINLAVSTAMRAPDPRNAVRVVLAGVHPPDGERGAWMPGFAGTFTDRQIVDLLSYARSRFSGQPAWDGLEDHVRNIRADKEDS